MSDLTSSLLQEMDPKPSTTCVTKNQILNLSFSYDKKQILVV